MIPIKKSRCVYVIKYVGKCFYHILPDHLRQPMEIKKIKFKNHQQHTMNIKHSIYYAIKILKKNLINKSLSKFKIKFKI